MPFFCTFQRSIKLLAKVEVCVYSAEARDGSIVHVYRVAIVIEILFIWSSVERRVIEALFCAHLMHLFLMLLRVI